MMSDGRKDHREWQLSQQIISCSESLDWSEAKREWSLVGLYLADEPQTCLCGHYPIKELCQIRNRLNGAEVIVGNVCVQKFMGITDAAKLFQSLRRIADDPKRTLNVETIECAHKLGWINDWERGFYLDTQRKRKLTDRQRTKRIEINSNILARAGGLT